MSRRNSIMVRRTYYQMGMVSLFSVLLWISISIYVALVTPSENAVDKSILSTIPPNIDATTIASISARIQIASSSTILVGDLPVASPSANPKIVTISSPPPSTSAGAVESSSSASVLP